MNQATEKQPRRTWTDVELAVLRRHYADTPTMAIAEAMRRPAAAVYRKANALGLKKSAAFLASPAAGRLDGIRGSKTRFSKGHTPWNKDAKGLDLGGKETQFKPGIRPHNTQPIGSYRHDGGGTLQRKISNDKGSNSMRWRGVHELIWTEVNGPVPPKHIVTFKPGMRTNVLEEITLDKVECISLAENMRRNTLHRYPKEIVDVIRARGVLNRRINNVQKHQPSA